MELPLSKRREKLESFASKYLKNIESFILSPQTLSLDVAKQWLVSMRGQLDGVVAKDLTLPYLPGKRAMQKIKNLRTADCVVGGFRYLAKQKIVGSLLLGLYDEAGLLHHVGFTSALDAALKAELTGKLEELVAPPGFTGRAPGGKSRWSTAKSSEWQPLRPELVVEIRYDHFTGDRFRHGTSLMRWRPEKDPRKCLMDQVRKETLSPLGLLG